MMSDREDPATDILEGRATGFVLDAHGKPAHLSRTDDAYAEQILDAQIAAGELSDEADERALAVEALSDRGEFLKRWHSGQTGWPQ